MWCGVVVLCGEVVWCDVVWCDVVWWWFGEIVWLSGGLMVMTVV